MLSKWEDPNRKPFTFPVNRTALQICKSYGEEVGETISKILEVEMEAFNQALINKSSEINKLREASWKRVIDEAKPQEEQVEAQIQ